MAILHLNCGTMTPYLPRVRAITYCLLVETNQGLLLVDSGIGLGDCARPTPWMRVFLALLRTPRDGSECAVRQVARLGYDPQDVRHIVLTHMHLDHTGGLPDFPWAAVHVYRAEYEAAMARRGWMRSAYRPEHWAHGPQWVVHDLEDEQWLGYDCVPVLEGLSPHVLLVPLPGHTVGHCGVAIETGEGWLLQCGDTASPYSAAADPNVVPGEGSEGPVDRWLVRRLIGDHVTRLRVLAQEQGDRLCLISAHDRPSWERFCT